MTARSTRSPHLRHATRRPNVAFYLDTFASQATKDQPIYDMKKSPRRLISFQCPNDQRIAVEGGLQRVANVMVLQELFP